MKDLQKLSSQERLHSQFEIMQENTKIYTIEQIRDELEFELREKTNIPEENQILSQFDLIFKETIFSEKALTLHQIQAIVNDTKNKQFQVNMHEVYHLLDHKLKKLQKEKHNKTKKEEQPKEQNEDGDDSFNFDSEQRERQSSQDDVDDDYINDSKKE